MIAKKLVVETLSKIKFVLLGIWIAKEYTALKSVNYTEFGMRNIFTEKSVITI